MRGHTLTWLGAALALVFLLAGTGEAHGGQYTGPKPGGVGTPRRGPTGAPRGGGVTAGLTPSWRDWWDRNREEFFNVLARRQSKADPATPEEEQNEGASALFQPLTEEELRTLVRPLIVAALADKSAEVRDAAAIALGRAGAIPQLEALKVALKDSRKSVREAATLGITLLQHPMAEQVLVDRLTQTDLGHRERGITALALGLSGGKRAFKALTDRLGKDGALRRVSRAKAREVEGARVYALGLIGTDAARAAITSALSSHSTKDSTFIPMALTALAHCGDPSSAGDVFRYLGHKKREIRRSAAIAAGRVATKKDKKWVQLLVRRQAAEKDMLARNFMLFSLGRIGGDQAVKTLRSVFRKDRQRAARAVAAVALGIARATTEIPALRKAVTAGKDETLRGAAAIALGIMGDRAAARDILKVLDGTGNPALQADLVTALGMLEAEEAGPAVRTLIARARNGRLVQACGYYLAVAGDSESIDLLLSLLEKSGSIQVKGGVATALGRSHDGRAAKRLASIVESARSTDQTRAFAIVALGLIADRVPISDFARVSIDSNYALQNADALREVIDIF